MPNLGMSSFISLTKLSSTALFHKEGDMAAFSKRFEGEGCSEVGGGLGAAGTQASARRARACRGVWGHPPPGNF